MKLINAWLHLADGHCEAAAYAVKAVDGIHAVYLDASAESFVDPEFGAEITFVPEKLKGWMSDHRHSEFWCRPAFGKDTAQIPEETQGLIYEKEDGRFGVILPVVSSQYKCVLCGSEAGITAKLFSWFEGLNDCKTLAFLWSEGEDPYGLLERCAAVGTRLLGGNCPVRKERTYPSLFEYLGWCSWDAFEIRVDEASLLAKCQEFKQKEIPVKWAIIDDMWAEIRDFYGKTYPTRKDMIRLMHNSRLYAFRADPLRFPNGLKHCIEKIREMGICVGMWHPTTGYWKGLDPEGPTYEALKDALICTEDGRYLPNPMGEKAETYYGTLHDYLKESGADFVKIDNQSMTRRFYKKLAPVGVVAKSFHDAIEDSVQKRFDGCMINCMGMGSEDMWNRKQSAISRCSDDFLPEDRAWFIKHILQCSYNCLIQGQFYYCDWDMWWTDDAQAEKNSVLRTISGGPIYVSDTLHRSRKEVLMPLILSDGRILRCDRPAVPSMDHLAADPTVSGRVFKLQNTCNGSGILAAFNLDVEDRPVIGTISPRDVYGLTGEEFVVYDYFSGDWQILRSEESFPLELRDNDDYRLYCITPLVNGCALIGRTDKMIAPATVCRKENGEVCLAEPGPYAFVRDYKLYRNEGKEDALF